MTALFKGLPGNGAYGRYAPRRAITRPMLLHHSVGHDRLGHAFEALRIARAAIASNDDEQIRIAADHCQVYEREAVKRELRAIRKAKAKAGGLSAGEKKASKSAEEWAPWKAEFKKRVDSGVEPATARNAVKNLMSKADPPFTVLNSSGTREFPSDRAIRNHMPGKNKSGTKL